MARSQENQLFVVHRAWEDYASLLLGIVVVFSPWIAGQTDHSSAVTSATLTGMLLIVISGLELFRLYRWHEVITLLMGAWLFASPLILQYQQLVPLAPMHIALGSVITILALLEIWQDWELSDDELGVHGR
jgi:predicted MFS family arabinose efflux permease